MAIWIKDHRDGDEQWLDIYHRHLDRWNQHQSLEARNAALELLMKHPGVQEALSRIRRKAARLNGLADKAIQHVEDKLEEDLLRSPPRFDNISHMKGRINCFCNCRYKDFLRNYFAHPTSSLPADEDGRIQPIVDERSLDEARGAQLREHILELIERLPTNLRTAARLSITGELDAKDIAAKLKKGTSTVRRWIKEAKAQLAYWLRGEFDG